MPTLTFATIGSNHLQHERTAPRNHRDGRQRRQQSERRRKRVDPLVRARRDDVFLENELQRVCERLKQPERPDAIRTGTILNQRAAAALDPDHDRCDVEQCAEDDGDFDER
jgi:hypothetical protein